MTDKQQLIEQLLPLARQASQRAYSPFSGIKVGAVVLGADGKLHAGCNVENASYGLTQCAERNALASAIVAGESRGKMNVLLIFATGFETLAPCGACRQVMSELLSPDATIISCAENEAPKAWSVADLLPDPFTLE
jgi:cytidine deaminase